MAGRRRERGGGGRAGRRAGGAAIACCQQRRRRAGGRAGRLLVQQAAPRWGNLAGCVRFGGKGVTSEAGASRPGGVCGRAHPTATTTTPAAPHLNFMQHLASWDVHHTICVFFGALYLPSSPQDRRRAHVCCPVGAGFSGAGAGETGRPRGSGGSWRRARQPCPCKLPMSRSDREPAVRSPPYKATPRSRPMAPSSRECLGARLGCHRCCMSPIAWAAWNKPGARRRCARETIHCQSTSIKVQGACPVTRALICAPCPASPRTPPPRPGSHCLLAGPTAKGTGWGAAAVAVLAQPLAPPPRLAHTPPSLSAAPAPTRLPPWGRLGTLRSGSRGARRSITLHARPPAGSCSSANRAGCQVSIMICVQPAQRSAHVSASE